LSRFVLRGGGGGFGRFAPSSTAFPALPRLLELFTFSLPRLLELFTLCTLPWDGIVPALPKGWRR